jgi:hypothetical protein
MAPTIAQELLQALEIRIPIKSDFLFAIIGRLGY